MSVDTEEVVTPENVTTSTQNSATPYMLKGKAYINEIGETHQEQLTM